MATGKLLRQLIKSGIEGNIEAFRAASEEVIKEERLKQHHLLANDLGKKKRGRESFLGTWPNDPLSSDSRGTHWRQSRPAAHRRGIPGPRRRAAGPALPLSPPSGAWLQGLIRMPIPPCLRRQAPKSAKSARASIT